MTLLLDYKAQHGEFSVGKQNFLAWTLKSFLMKSYSHILRPFKINLSERDRSMGGCATLINFSKKKYFNYLIKSERKEGKGFESC